MYAQWVTSVLLPVIICISISYSPPRKAIWPRPMVTGPELGVNTMRICPVAVTDP